MFVNIIKITFCVVAVLLAVFIVKVATIGPVILVVSEAHGWGVHIGDLLSVPLLVLAILIIRSFFK